MSQKAKAPAPRACDIRASLYDAAKILGTEVEDRPGGATCARVQITGPKGEKATAFLSLCWIEGRWYAYLGHDATDYATDKVEHREARVRLRFFKQ